MGLDTLSCCSCEQEKPVTEFTKRPDRPRGYMYHCKACQVIRTKNSANKARENYLARRRAQYREKAEVLKAKALERYYNNQEHNLQRLAQWKKENTTKVYASNNARKRRARLSTPLWADLQKVKQLYKIAATWNELWPEDPVHVDHIIPLKGRNVSGLHTELNLRIIRATDNMRKSNKLLDISST